MMDQNQINFTPRAQKIVKDAKLEAFKINEKVAGLEHLFLAFYHLFREIYNQVLCLCQYLNFLNFQYCPDDQICPNTKKWQTDLSCIVLGIYNFELH